MNDAPPHVSVLLPVLDEAERIDACLESLAAQDLTEPWELLVIDGGSTDDTRARARAWADRIPHLHVVDNPARVQSLGCNRAAAEVARGEILVRLDGHVDYAEDYLRRSVDALRGSDAVAVGGRQIPVGVDGFARAAAIAMTSVIAAGPGRYRHATEATEVDTVYLGTFRRDDFLAIGGYRALPSGVAEDADLYARWRRADRSILLDPAIRSRYHPRSTPRAFARQHLRYGRGKAELLWIEGRFPSWRPLAPLVLVLTLLATAIVGASTGSWSPFTTVSAAWLLAIAYVGIIRGCSTLDALRIAGAVGLMHLPYGLGLLQGLLRGPGPPRRAVRTATPVA